MGNFRFYYLHFVLSTLCILLMSCKDDLIGKELVYYEVTMFRVLDGNQPESIPKNCILYYDSSDGSDYNGGYDGDFFYKGDKYCISFIFIPISEMKAWFQDQSSVKVLLSGCFEDNTPNDSTQPCNNNTRSSDDTDIVFFAKSITLKK